MWYIFGFIIILLLVLDLGVLNKDDKPISFTKSSWLSVFYIAIACIFGYYIHIELGSEKSSEYFTGFLLEKAMSLDNIFVISIIFKFFNIPAKYQHRVLFWGILGVIVLRAIMISAGVILIAKFQWLLFIFGAILIFTGIKTFYIIDQDVINIKEMYIYKLLSSNFNVYPKLEGNKFFIKKDNKLFITPLFMALITIEFIDAIFAIDSIPAIFAITQDIFIIYTSNIFAIMGLRALFFCLSNIVEKFKYVKYSLALILILIGLKIFLIHFIKIPTYIPLLITVILLFCGIIISVKKQHNDKRSSTRTNL